MINAACLHPFHDALCDVLLAFPVLDTLLATPMSTQLHAGRHDPQLFV